MNDPIPHWKRRRWTLSLTPELWQEAEEAVNLPEFSGNRNQLLTRALKAYLRMLHKKGRLTPSEIEWQRAERESAEFAKRLRVGEAQQ
jgi:hypothetical protein